MHSALAWSALAASLVLFFGSPGKLLAGIALLASGLEVLMALGILHVAVARLPLGLVLGLGIALPGVIAWFRATPKPAVSAAAIVTFVGVLQVIVYAAPRL